MLYFCSRCSQRAFLSLIRRKVNVSEQRPELSDGALEVGLSQSVVRVAYE